jgi:hypothetical protein
LNEYLTGKISLFPFKRTGGFKGGEGTKLKFFMSLDDHKEQRKSFDQLDLTKRGAYK